MRRPSSSTSRNPRVVIRPVAASLRSSNALVVVVVPCTSRSRAARSAPVRSSASSTPNAWFSVVVGTFAIRTSPDASSRYSRSVNVPPTSTPARRWLMGVSRSCARVWAGRGRWLEPVPESGRFIIPAIRRQPRSAFSLRHTTCTIRSRRQAIRTAGGAASGAMRPHIGMIHKVLEPRHAVLQSADGMSPPVSRIGTLAAVFFPLSSCRTYASIRSRCRSSFVFRRSRTAGRSSFTVNSVPSSVIR